VLQVVEADFSRVDQARRGAGAQWKSREGYSLTYLPFVAHAIVVRPVGMLAQTFDHRAVDGSYSGAFLSQVKTLIETRDWARELQA